MKHNTLKNYFKKLGFKKKLKRIKMKQHWTQLQHIYIWFDIFNWIIVKMFC